VERTSFPEKVSLRQFHEGTKTSRDTFTIITYNIGWLSGMTNNLPVERPLALYRNNLQKMEEVFNKLQPDIIAFQEIDLNADRSYRYNQVDSIASNCRYPHVHVALNWNTRYVPFPYWPPSMHFGATVSAQAIVSKYPFETAEINVLQPPMDAPFYYRAFYLDRLAEVGVILISDELQLCIINVHLEAFSQQTRIQQARELIGIYRRYAEKYPVFLVGDFNAVPPYEEIRGTKYEEPTITYFRTEPGLEEVMLKDKMELSDTASYTFSSAQPAGKIDYIFYTKSSIEVIEAHVVVEAGEASDHLPLMATFTFKTEN